MSETKPLTAEERDLPPRIVVGKNGAYWRDYDDSYSMCPVSTDNDPVEPVAVYVLQAEAPTPAGLDVARLGRALSAAGIPFRDAPEMHIQHARQIAAQYAALAAQEPG